MVRSLFISLSIFLISISLVACEFSDTSSTNGEQAQSTGKKIEVNSSNHDTAVQSASFSSTGSQAVPAQGNLSAQEIDSTVYASRDNAITHAVRRVSPAVVSITVTEVVQGGRRLAFDEFYGFFLAPQEREFNSRGSGFIIS